MVFTYLHRMRDLLAATSGMQGSFDQVEYSALMRT